MVDSAGVALWRLKPVGRKWAKWLFAFQIPVFSVWRFIYEFSTFLSFRLMMGNTTHRIGGNIGSSSNLNLLPQPMGFLFGVNLVAVPAFLYLVLAANRGLSLRQVRARIATSAPDTPQPAG